MIPSQWPQVVVRDLLQGGTLFISDGFRARSAQLGRVGVPFVRGGDIGDGWIDTEVADHVLPEFSEQIAVKLTRPGDVAFITKGTVGRTGRLRAGQPAIVFAPQVCYWRSLDTAQLDPTYLFYLLRSRWFQAQLDGVKTSGSMVADYVSLAHQQHFRLPVPPIEAQRRIGAILGALDDKIELNRKMNRTLEEMAQALFKSWFVDFDGHTDLVDSPMGRIPRGWSATTVGRVVTFLDSRRVPLSSIERATRPGPYPYHGATGVMDHVDDFLFDGVHILVGEDGSVVDEEGHPVMQYVWGRFWVNNHAHVLLPHEPLGAEHLLIALRQSDVRPFVTGAVQAKVSQGNLRKMPFLLPDPASCERFNQLVVPIYARFRLCTDECKTLAELRDLLLPKLISGEIRVRDAEAVVEEAL